MIKRFVKAGVLMVSVAMLPLCFSSCGDDDDDEVVSSSGSDDETEEEEGVDLSDVVDTYINDVVYPTYTNLADATTDLYEGLVDMQEALEAGTLSQSDIDDVCETFLSARAYWEASEAWLYGPADQFGIDPHIDTWPLDRSELASLLGSDELRANLEGDIEDAIVYISEQNGEVSHLGFHGVEFILFRDGENRTVADLEGVEDDDAFSGVTVTGAYELTYAIAVAGDLRDWTSYLEVAWMGTAAASSHISRCTTRGFQLILDGIDNYYGEEMLLAGNGSELYEYTKEAINAILIDGCSNICAEVADQKMGQPYRAATGQATDEEVNEEDYVGKDYIESPYSHKSFVDFYDNITSIKNALYGNIDGDDYDDNSIMAYLTENNSSMASNLDEALNNALDALQDCIDYGVAFVTIINNTGTYSTGMDLVYDAMQEIDDLDEYLNEASDWISKN